MADGEGIIDVLGRAGFQVVRVRGSHHFLKHEDGRRTVVPVHAGQTIGPGLFGRILRECKLSADDVQGLLAG